VLAGLAGDRLMAVAEVSAFPVEQRAQRVRPAEVSVVVPVFNEQGNIPGLCDRLIAVLRPVFGNFEIIAVNDGSRDNSLGELKDAALRYRELRVVDLRRNYGQTAALMAGIDHASADVIVLIDADLQNEPEDIPRLVAKLAEGYDVVSGWRKERKDAAIRRNMPSRLANHLISYISGVRLRDYGCTLKAYRRDVLKGMRLYGEMHRFIPIYASWMGAKIVEVPVRHHPRQCGSSNYGLGRIFKVILDLMVVKFLDRHFVSPIYLFGGFGIVSFALSALSTMYMLYLKIFQGLSMILTPLPLVSTLTFLVGVMSILMGLLAEMLVRTYFESQHLAAYTVRSRINFEHPV
jgi:glycosyltransferase involved in cell wall biosynthesis